MNNDFSRRDILKGSAVALAGLAGAVPALAEGSSSPAPLQGMPSDKRLRFGIIGCGGKGESGMAEASRFGDIVALADIDVRNRAKALDLHPRATSFDDYRDMFVAMRGKLDAVVISIPDHHHAVASSLAMHQHLHCYTEKPLCRTIWEARQLQRIARETRVATQMGNQSTASTPMRKAAALIQAGHFGAPKEVHVWTDRAKGWWPVNMDIPAASTPPKEVDFEMWLGPRPERPYGEGYLPFVWRGWWDFGTGALGDMGCHIFNMPYMALNLRDPIAVQAETSGHNKKSFPDWSIVHYEFGELNGRPPIKLTWYDSGKKPDPSVAPGIALGGNGSVIICEKGTIVSMDESNTNIALVGGGTLPDVQVDESPGHMAEFARAALGGPPAKSNFPGYSGPLAETVLLGNLAIWANGPRLEWDAKRMKVKGADEYDELIYPKFRAGFGV